MNTKTRFQKTLGYATVCPAIVMAAAAVLGVHAQAQTVIQDNFSGSGGPLTAPNSRAIVGLAPTIDLGTNATWQWMSAYSGNQAENGGFYGLPSPEGAFFRSATGGGIGLGSYGNSGSTLETSVTGSFFMTNAANAMSSSGYILAGFSNADLSVTSTKSGSYATNPRALATYTGLAIMGDGSLQEFVAGTPQGDVPWAGTTLANFGAGQTAFGRSPAASLTYDLNTTTGAITNVSFSISGYGASTADYSSFATAPGSFASADLTDNEIGGSGGHNDVYAGYGENDTSNWVNYTAYQLSTVGAVPEPATCGAVLGGLGMLLGLQKFRSRKA